MLLLLTHLEVRKGLHWLQSKQISAVSTVNPIVKKEVHLIKETNNVIQSMVLTKYLGYINRSKFYIMLCIILQKTLNNDINIRTYKVYWIVSTEEPILGSSSANWARRDHNHIINFNFNSASNCNSFSSSDSGYNFTDSGDRESYLWSLYSS